MLKIKDIDFSIKTLKKTKEVLKNNAKTICEEYGDDFTDNDLPVEYSSCQKVIDLLKKEKDSREKELYDIQDTLLRAKQFIEVAFGTGTTDEVNHNIHDAKYLDLYDKCNSMIKSMDTLK